MEAIVKILEKIIESKRVLWVVLLASFLFLCFEDWWRAWLRSDNISDVAVICSIVAFLVSASFVVIDWFSALFRRVAGYFEARARIRKNKKMLSCLRRDEILLLREFIIINSNIITIKNLPGNRAVDDLRKKSFRCDPFLYIKTVVGVRYLMKLGLFYFLTMKFCSMGFLGMSWVRKRGGWC